MKYEDIVEKYPGYERICECFFEFVEKDEDKEILKQILKSGTYKEFNVNTRLSNSSSKIEEEIDRRLSIAEIFLFNRTLFNFMIENKINVYHGTDVKALPTILKHGLMTYKSAIDNNIDVSTGEMRWLLKKLKETYPDLNFAYPNFISLTDDFSVAKRYSIDSDVYAKIPLMLCMSENDLIKKYTKSIVNIKSNMTEIGVASDISLEDIKCFITTPQNADYVSQFIKDKNIPIFIYEPNKKLEFYDFKYNVDEEKFNIYREKIKYQLTIENIKNTNNQNNILSDDVHDYVQLGGKIR